MNIKPITQKQFKTFQTKVGKRFDGVDKRLDVISRLVDFKFETFREEMMRFLDDKFTMLDKTGKRIEDHRQEQIVIGQCLLRFGDQLDNHEKRIYKLEIVQ